MIHIGMGGAFLAEVVLTAMFVFVILAVTSKSRNTAATGAAIGLSLTVANLIGIAIDGTSVNPARSLGPALIVGGTALNQVWLFIVAPLVGGAVAAGLNYLVFENTAAVRPTIPIQRSSVSTAEESEGAPAQSRPQTP